MRTSIRERAPYAPLIERAILAAGGRQEDLAARLGVNQQIISKLLYGDTPLTAGLAIGIHRATEGAVPGSALRPDLWRSPEHVPVEAEIA